jgi:hypothetical protein
MMKFSIKIQFFLMTAFLRIHLYGMEPTDLTKNCAGVLDPALPLFKEILPLRTLTAFACANKKLYKEFNTADWIKKFIDAGLRDNYIRVNGTIMQLCETALPQMLSVSSRRPTIFFSSQSSSRSPSKRETIEPIEMNVERFISRFDNRYADVNYIERMTRPHNSLLMQASNSLNIQLIFALVEKRADVNLCSPSGSHSPISRAIQSRVFCSDLLRRTLKHEIETIRCLVDLGADIHYIEPKYNWNYLFYAIYYKNFPLIPLLLQYGINPNHQNNSLKNPLCFILSGLNMSSDGVKDAVIALMKAGSNPFAKDSKGKSSIDYARQYSEEYPDYLALLREYRKGSQAWYTQQQLKMIVNEKGVRINFT